MASYFAAAEALRHLMIPSSRVRSTGVELGRGSYGKVFEVEYDGKLCASKEVHRWMMELPSAEEQSRIKDDFLRECHLWSTLRHPNVVQFLGIYYPSSDESLLPVMVMEKMQENVTSLVDKHDNIPLLVKLSILHDVSLGVRYLHGHNPPILHRDLSSNNILVNRHLEAKITDLGVAKAMTMGPNSKTLTKTPGTGVFMPPEALDDKPVYGPPLDVFSFGGVILHIASRQWPTPKSWSQIDPKTRKRIMLSEVERRQQYIDMMSGSDADLKPLVVSCLEDDPELRPLAADMSERIKVMKEEYSKKTTRDGMDSISWLAEINQTSTQLQQQLVVKESTIPDLFSGPVDIKWEEGAPAPVGRSNHTAVLCDGVIYVGGGWIDGNVGIQYLTTLDTYNPDTNTWDTIDTPHEQFTLTVLTGKVVIVGGYNRNGKITNKVLVLESGQCKDYTEMPTPRCDVTAISHQQMLIVMGGYDDDYAETVNTTELFDATTGQWFKCDDLPQPLFYCSHSVIVGDSVFMLGGYTKDNNPSTAVYTAPLGTLSSHQLKWQRLVDTPCGGSAAVGLNNKYLLAVGGNNIYTLNSTATTWMTTGTLPVWIMHTAVVCDDTRLVMIGGYSDGKSTNKVWIGSFQY